MTSLESEEPKLDTSGLEKLERPKSVEEITLRPWHQRLQSLATILAETRNRVFASRVNRAVGYLRKTARARKLSNQIDQGLDIDSGKPQDK
jgi:hypothetical protein